VLFEVLRHTVVGDQRIAPRIGGDQFRQQFRAQSAAVAGDPVDVQFIHRYSPANAVNALLTSRAVPSG